MEGLGTSLQKLLDALDGGVQQHYDSSGSGFRPRFYPVAQQLRDGRARSIRSLSQAIGISHSAVSQTVTAMRAAGLASSAPGAEDARERLVQLTPQGRRTCERHAALWDAVACAADELNGELPMPLDVLVKAALERLQAESFAERIGRSSKALADEPTPAASDHSPEET